MASKTPVRNRNIKWSALIESRMGVESETVGVLAEVQPAINRRSCGEQGEDTARAQWLLASI